MQSRKELEKARQEVMDALIGVVKPKYRRMNRHALEALKRRLDENIEIAREAERFGVDER